MTALVGKFAPGAGWYSARPVDLEGQPSWLLAQMWSIWRRRFACDTQQMCATLLREDWSVLAQTAWPEPLMQDPSGYRYVNGVGRAYRRRAHPFARTRHMPTDAPHAGEQWAYLWENACGAMHVYRAAFGRWHHLATLPVDVFTELTPQLIADIEARQHWLERAA
jgi:hypothetical protein